MTIQHACARLLPTSLLGLLLSTGAALATPPQTPAKSGSTNPGTDRANDDVVLPPAPTGATPASAMRLPNLPTLGNSASSAEAPVDTAPAPQPGSPAIAAAPEPTPAPAVPPTSPAAIAVEALKQRTGLSDAQLTALQAAQTHLTSGDEAGALSAAQALSTELDNEAREYVVGEGENLFAIAGRTEVYANSKLWPLLWWSNLPALREPWQVRKGMRLKVLAHPSVEQVSTALNYARTHNVLTSHLEDTDLPPNVVTR